MTAVIGILNKSAVALAADSAVTIGTGNGHKIFNTANKIFTLSKYQPIGIMVYNAASFMFTPWETIIKIYRDHLGENYFTTVLEYKDDFLGFLKQNHYFTTPETQKAIFNNFVNTNIVQISNEIAKTESVRSIVDEEAKKDELLIQLKINLRETIQSFLEEKSKSELFLDYSFEDYSSFSATIVNENVNSIFQKIENQELIALFNETFYLYLKSRKYMGPCSGLVFTGFGSMEIFPCLVSIQIAEVFDNKARYFIDQTCAIDEFEMSGSIIPFAQRDVIDTLITGVSPELDATYIGSFKEFVIKYNNLISNRLIEKDPELAKSILNINIDEIVDEYEIKMNEVKQTKHIAPIVNTVALLSKEDLAEMAESMIYLTYLKRRISFAEESVGGPVDVALISKGEGFIWIKRKHYFNPDLNQHFFNNYFKPNFIKP